MNVKNMLRNLIQKKKGQITNEQLFGKQFYAEAKQLIRSVTGRDYDLEIIHDPENPLTGCTNGTKIRANTGCSLIQDLSSPSAKVASALGLILHECSHLLDGIVVKDVVETRQQVARGLLPIQRTMLSEQEQAVKDALARPIARHGILEVWNRLTNIGLDARDEGLLYSNFGGVVGHCITALNTPILNGLLPVEDLRAKGKGNTLMSLIFQRTLFGSVAAIDRDAFETSEEGVWLKNLVPQIEVLQTSADKEARAEAAFQILVALLPEVASEAPPEQNGAPGSDEEQGTAVPLPFALEQMGPALEQMASDAAGAMSSTTPTIQNPTRMGGGMKPPSQSGNQQNEDSAASRVIDTMVQQIQESVAEEEAIQELQQEIASATDRAIRAVKLPKIHRGVPFTIERPDDASEYTYNKIMEEVGGPTRRLVASMKAMFEEIRQGSTTRGVSTGRLDSRSLYRLDIDQRIFYDKTAPRDVPDLAVMIVLDQSGSMDGEKIVAARKTAIILDQFCSELDIPCMILGHTTGWNNVRLFVHREFDQVDKKGKYKLASLETYGCNRDGLPLSIGVELLGNRPEQDKLLILVSDGAPNDRGYEESKAKKDLQDIVKDAERKYNIAFIAAGLGQCKEALSNIYGNHFLDVTNPQRLPAMLTKIVRERLEAE